MKNVFKDVHFILNHKLQKKVLALCSKIKDKAKRTERKKLTSCYIKTRSPETDFGHFIIATNIVECI